MLDGHSLELKLSNREVPDVEGLKRKSVNATKQGQSTKLLVRNIPFQVISVFLLYKVCDFRQKYKKLKIFLLPLEKFETFAFQERLEATINIADSDLWTFYPLARQSEHSKHWHILPICMDDVWY